MRKARQPGGLSVVHRRHRGFWACFYSPVFEEVSDDQLDEVVSRKWLEFEGGVISGLFRTQGRRWSAGRRSRHDEA